MLNFFKNKKGQNTAEYAILIALVIGAAIAMQTYVKRGMQGSVKFAVDKVKKDDAVTRKGQYEPYYLESSSDTTKSVYQDTTQTEAGGKVTRTIGAEGTEHKTTRTGYEKMRGIANQD
jgi:Flp pilus assembly pilin Flp